MCLTCAVVRGAPAAHKTIAIAGVGVIALVAYRLLSFVGTVLTLVILWGVAADTARVRRPVLPTLSPVLGTFMNCLSCEGSISSRTEAAHNALARAAHRIISYLT